MEDIYQDLIMDHFQSPRNWGTLKKSSATSLVYNPLCGDKISMEMLIQKETVQKIAFTAQGCALSRASASLLTQYSEGKKVKELLDLDTSFMLKLTQVT